MMTDVLMDDAAFRNWRDEVAFWGVGKPIGKIVTMGCIYRDSH